MGCGGSVEQPADRQAEKAKKYDAGEKNSAASPNTTKKDGGSPGKSPDATEKGEGVTKGENKKGKNKKGKSDKPPPHSITAIHAKHRLECKFGDIEKEHRQKLWRIIRGQDMIARGPPTAESMGTPQTHVSIRTDFGGDIHLLLSAEEAAKVQKAEEEEQVIDARELLTTRAAPARELQRLHVRCVRGHSKGLKVCLLSPNDWLLVTTHQGSGVGTTDELKQGAARCTDIRTGLHVGSLDARKKGVFDAIAAAAFTTDGQMLATVHRSDQLLFWDMNTFRVKKQVEVAEEGMEDFELRLVGVALSPDMKLCACATEIYDDDGEGKGRVAVYDLNGKRKIIFGEHEACVGAVAFTPDSCEIVSGDAAGQLIIWAATTGEVRRRFEGHTAGIKSLCFSPAGDWLYSLDERFFSCWNCGADAPEGDEAVRWTLPILGKPVEGKTAIQLAEELESAGPEKKNPPRLKYTTAALAAQGSGFVGITDRKCIVFNSRTGEELEQVTTKSPVTAMSAGCQVGALGDMWGNLYLVDVK